MALLPERPCALRPRTWAFVGAVVLEVVPEGFCAEHHCLRLDRTNVRRCCGSPSPGPGVGGSYRGIRGGCLLFTYGPHLVKKSAPLVETGRAGSKTGYTRERKSLWFSCCRCLPAWHHNSVTVCEVRRFRGNIRLIGFEAPCAFALRCWRRSESRI
jgi:hypothetical protein